MFKISSSNSSDKGVALLLEGRILNHSIEELKDSCERFLAQRRRLTLDLSGVSFICQDGVCILQCFEERQVTLINCSGFVAEQLKIHEHRETDMRLRRYLLSLVNQRYRHPAHGSRPTPLGTRGKEVLGAR